MQAKTKFKIIPLFAGAVGLGALAAGTHVYLEMREARKLYDSAIDNLRSIYLDSDERHVERNKALSKDLELAENMGWTDKIEILRKEMQENAERRVKTCEITAKRLQRNRQCDKLRDFRILEL